MMALTAGWNVYQSRNEVDLSDLTLENVEALANIEYGGGGACHIWCCQTRYDDCVAALHANGCTSMNIYLDTSC
ncbi:MAG: hypothetical protein IJD84_10700 [Parabacteroides sp.]|nr:hypothetical protein [Parabacteroides sp.]